MKNQQARSNEDLYILSLPANRLTVRFTCLLIVPLLLLGLFISSEVMASLTGINEVRCQVSADEPTQACSGEDCEPVSASAAGTRCSSSPAATFRRESGDGSPLAQRYLDGLRSTPSNRAGGEGETFFGDLAGDWDEVTGYITFPYSWDDVVDDYILVRGLPAERLPDSNTYQVNNWTRSAYWIDIGDGRPRFLSSKLLDPDYVPEPDDPFVDSGELNYAQLVLYREEGRDYSAYPEEAAFGSLLFLVDPVSGQVIDAVVDLRDANGEYEKTEYLYVGDELQPLLNTYVLTEPESIYYAFYGDFITLSQDHTVDRASYIPGLDFVDPDLAELEFDAYNAPLTLLLEGFSEPDKPEGDPEWAYSKVYPLGYTWGEGIEVIFRTRFEATAGTMVTSGVHQDQVRIVRSRSD
jgi:hypothetical protein